MGPAHEKIVSPQNLADRFSMANSNHVAALDRFAEPRHRHGSTGNISGWNQWRRENGFEPLDLSGADLSGLCLDDGEFQNVNLQRAILRGVHAHGVNFWRCDLTDAHVGMPSASKAMAPHVFAPELSESNLCWATLVRADLRNVWFSGSDLSNADLRAANLEGAHLDGSDLTGATLTGCNLRAADLREAVLRQTLFDGAVFSEATFGATVFTDVDLSKARGLDTTRHEAPSIIDIQTLTKSHHMPVSFLRGVGVPDIWIPSLQVGSSEFLSCFISYSHRDEAFCQKLHARLQSEGLRVWFAPEEMKAGRKLYEQIHEAIGRYDKTLIVLSEHSMKSNWVVTEIRRARDREEAERKRVLFPIRLVPFDQLREWEAFDADAGKDLAVEVREYFIPDFSEWKNERKFENEVKKLVAALRA